MSAACLLTTDSLVSPPPPELSLGCILRIVSSNSLAVLLWYLQGKENGYHGSKLIFPMWLGAHVISALGCMPKISGVSFSGISSMLLR